MPSTQLMGVAYRYNAELYECYYRKLDSCHITFVTSLHMRQDSSVGIATGYGLPNRMNEVRFLAGAGNLSRHRVQTGSGAHPASYPMGTRGSFPGGKAARS
jgi:hypothetical protein